MRLATQSDWHDAPWLIGQLNTGKNCLDFALFMTHNTEFVFSGSGSG